MARLTPGYQAFEIRSSRGDRSYEIFVAVPDGPPPAGGFPTLYVLDGNADFVTVAETMRRVSRRPAATGIGPAIVVGIGYPCTADYNAGRRHLDFTRGAAAAGMFSDVPAASCGGQGDHRAFIRDDLLPAIAARFAASDQRRTLLGHSLAGYFTLDLLAQEPGAFSSYVSFSPSLWWDRPGLSGRLAAAPRPEAAIRVFVTVGRWEQEVAPWQAAGLGAKSRAIRAQRRMIDNARDVSAEIGAVLGDRVAIRFEVGDDDDHASIVTSALCRALRFTQTP